MSNHKMSFGLAAFCAAVVFVAGCIPENSLEWSEDGSVGLLRVEEALYLVDGETGELSEIARENVQPWPDISEDGSLIAYSQAVECSSLTQGIKQLPPGQVKIVKYFAAQIRKNVLEAGGLTNDEFPFPDENIMTSDEYRNWPIRYLCENADTDLLKVLPDEAIKKGKEMAIGYFQVVIVPVKALQEKRTLTTSLFNMIGLKFSPNGKHLAYLMHTQEGQTSNSFEEDTLCIASLENDVKAMLVESGVAFGYDWRKDSQAIAYLSADLKNLLHDDDLILGTLSEKMVADADGGLLAKPEDVHEHGSAGTHRCTGKTDELVGTVFYPWFKVEYGLDNRIFFSSLIFPLPMSKRDEPGCSLFCYDPVTGTVADVLPLSVSIYTSQQILGISLFSLSPDGKHVLLPIKHNRFVVYELGTDSMEIPIPEEEGFGEEEIPKLAPSWKGSNEFSFLVSGKSKFLPEPKEGEDQDDREQIIVLETDGKNWILSKNWPNEIKVDSQDNQ